MFHRVIETLDSRTSDNSSTTSCGKLFVFQGRVVSGDKYSSQLLEQFSDSKGHIVLITGTTSIAESLYENGGTLHSLLVLEVYGKDSRYATASGFSEYGLCFDRSEWLYSSARVISD